MGPPLAPHTRAWLAVEATRPGAKGQGERLWCTCWAGGPGRTGNPRPQQTARPASPAERSLENPEEAERQALEGASPTPTDHDPAAAPAASPVSSDHEGAGGPAAASFPSWEGTGHGRSGERGCQTKDLPEYGSKGQAGLKLSVPTKPSTQEGLRATRGQQRPPSPDPRRSQHAGQLPGTSTSQPDATSVPTTSLNGCLSKAQLQRKG